MGAQLELEWENAVNARATKYANKIVEQAADRATKNMPQGSGTADPEERARQLDAIEIARQRTRAEVWDRAYEDERKRAEPEEWARIAAAYRAGDIASDVVR